MSLFIIFSKFVPPHRVRLNIKIRNRDRLDPSHWILLLFVILSILREHDRVHSLLSRTCFNYRHFYLSSVQTKRPKHTTIHSLSLILLERGSQDYTPTTNSSRPNHPILVIKSKSVQFKLYGYSLGSFLQFILNLYTQTLNFFIGIIVTWWVTSRLLLWFLQ